MHLLEAGVEPDEAATSRAALSIHLKLELIEASVALLVYLLLEVDPVRTVHLVQDFLHARYDLLLIRGVREVGRALAAAAVDALNEPRLGYAHLQNLLREVGNDFLLYRGVFEVRVEILLCDHQERRRGSTYLLTDPFEYNGRL